MTTYRVTGGLVSETPEGKLLGPIELTPVATRKPTRDYRDVYGVCSHPNFDSPAYIDPDKWFGHLLQLGAKQFRGMFAIEMDRVQRTLELCQENGVKWLATVASGKTTEKQLRHRLAEIAKTPEVFCGIEGINEPELTDAGIAKVVKFQKIIWDFVHDNNLDIPVLSPAMKMNWDRSTLHRFTVAGIKGTFDVVSRHQYNGPDAPNLQALGVDLDMFVAEWGVTRFWVTETGYTNALASKDPRKATEAVAAVYSIPQLLEFLTDERVEKVFRYELEDDNDPGLINNEAHFGLFRFDGTAKPEVAVIGAFLMTTQDDDEDYDPPEVVLEIQSEDDWVESVLVGRSDGLATLWLWQPEANYDATPVDVQITTAAGIATVHVGAAPVGVPIQ